jgi:DNA-binding transcriptional LysR family regulator
MLACTTAGGFVPDIRHRTTDLLVLLALVATGRAVTLLPELARPERESSVTVRDTGISRRVLTVVRDDGLARPALTAVRTALSEVAFDLVPG